LVLQGVGVDLPEIDRQEGIERIAERGKVGHGGLCDYRPRVPTIHIGTACGRLTGKWIVG